MASATGDNRNASGLSCQAAKISIAEVTTTNPATNCRDSLPAGSARVLVRGLAASMSASTSRLNAIAAERPRSGRRRSTAACAPAECLARPAPLRSVQTGASGTSAPT